MLELAMKKALEKRLQIPVLFEEDDNLVKFVRMERLGSSEWNHSIHARYAFQSYDESLYLCAKLNEDVKKAVRKLEELPYIFNVVIDTDFYFPNISDRKYRYQMIARIDYQDSD